MSNTLASLRRKIEGAAKLGSVVRTMKAVAASSIGQYEKAIGSLADYEHAVKLGLSVCFRPGAGMAASSNRAPSGAAIGAIVFGSDQGLVGQFNEAVARLVQTKLAGMAGDKKLWIVGERIGGGLAESGLPVAGQFAVPCSVDGITSLVEQLQVALEDQKDKRATEILVFHARPTSGALYEPTCQRLLPLDAEWQQTLAKMKWPAKKIPELFGNHESALRAFVREYLFIVLYKACAESLASENASRLAAMQRAEKNIDSLAKELNRSFHRLRQNSIDEELFDVISGFNSLSPAK
jgi:F-type H+-transporting ATPase subunit gamma